MTSSCLVLSESAPEHISPLPQIPSPVTHVMLPTWSKLHPAMWYKVQQEQGALPTPVADSDLADPHPCIHSQLTHSQRLGCAEMHQALVTHHVFPFHSRPGAPLRQPLPSPFCAISSVDSSDADGNRVCSSWLGLWTGNSEVSCTVAELQRTRPGCECCELQP